MKNIVYFNKDKHTNKLSSIVTDQSVEQLKSNGIINPDAATLIKPFVEDCREEDSLAFAKQVHVDKLVFDDPSNPTDVVFDLELVKMYYINIFRQMRTSSLEILDRYQMRALTLGYSDLLKDIENDKQSLRDLPENLEYDDVSDIFDISKIYPQSLLVNYEEKYSYEFVRRDRVVGE